LWPKRPALFVEADPAGGVIAARFGLAQEPGLASLAAAARHGGEVVGSEPFVQQIPLWFNVVVGPGSPETATGAVGVLAVHPHSTLDALAPVVIADVGRLYVGSPAMGMLAAADAVVVVACPTTEYLDHLDHRLGAVREAARSAEVGLVLNGKAEYPTDEVAGRLGVPVWAQLPRDRWGAGVLSGRMTGRAWSRTRLGQGVRELAAAVANRLTGVPGHHVEVRR
jgi:hypothetical protein